MNTSSATQHVLVTGGTGFVGQALISHLLAEQHHVIVLTRSTERVTRLWGERVQAVTDVHDIPDTQPIHAIINLAGARILGHRWSDARKAELRHSRIGLTQHIINWLNTRNQRPRVLLSASAIGYYGIQPQNAPNELTETSPPQSIFMSELCQEWENASAQAVPLGIVVAAMRFGLVLGKNGGALPMMLLPIKLGIGGKLGSGMQMTSWIHIDDLIRGLMHVWQHIALQSPSFQAYNFTSPQPVTQTEFTQTAATLLHRPAFIPTPSWPLKWLLGEQADLLLEGQKVIPAALLTSGFTFRYPTLHGALQAILQT